VLTSIAISPDEHAARCEALLAEVEAARLTGVVLFDPYYVLYYAGFAFVPTERPVAFVLSSDGTRTLVVPRLEVEHAESKSTIDRVEHYLEYPGDPRAEDVLARTLAEAGVTGAIGADQDGYPWILGYRGPTLSELSGATVVRVVEQIERQMAVKSPAEIALIRESIRWSNLAHRLLQRYTRLGATETEVSQRASNEATFAMLDAIGEIYRAQSFLETGAAAGYRGQIGRNAAIPHALAGNLVFQEGDVLVTGASAPVWGYLSELERTMFLGEASAEQRELFDHMVALLQPIARQAWQRGHGECLQFVGGVRCIAPVQCQRRALVLEQGARVTGSWTTAASERRFPRALPRGRCWAAPPAPARTRRAAGRGSGARGRPAPPRAPTGRRAARSGFGPGRRPAGRRTTSSGSSCARRAARPGRWHRCRRPPGQ
jgi:Xaa-Pro aminopeptidase